MSKPNKPTGKLTHPPPTKNGVKVYYDGQTEAYLRAEAAKHGFRNVQDYLKFKARRERLAAQGRGQD